jgi:hypothetical protein
MRRSALLLCLLALPAGAVPPLGASDDDAIQEVSGEIRGDQEWSGHIRITGDVVIAKGSRLRIRAGTEVLVARGEGPPSGWSPTRIEVHVDGTLQASGTPEQPVTFAPEHWAPGAGRSRFVGIILKNPDPSSPSVLRGVVIRGAEIGVQTCKSRALIEDCRFENCSFGVLGGVSYLVDYTLPWPQWKEILATMAGWGRVDVRRTTFFDCARGIDDGLWEDAVTKSTPHVYGCITAERCVFDRCSVGVGLRTVDLVSRCDFLRCRTAVGESGVVEDSIFQDCDLVYRGGLVFASLGLPSWSSDLAHRCRQVESGCSGVATSLILGDPLYAGPLPAERGPPVLPDALRLSPGSPALGAATDGGDLGSQGRPGSQSRRDRLRDAAAGPESAWLLLGPMGASKGRAPLWQGRSSQASAAGPDGRRWETVRTSFGRTLDLRPDAGWDPGEEVRAVQCWTAPAAGDGQLEVSADATEGEVWWNGRSLRPALRPARFEVPGARFPVALQAGVNVLEVRLVPRGNEPLLCATLRAGDSPIPAWMPEPAAPRIIDSCEWQAGARALDSGGIVTGSVLVRTREPVHWRDLGRSDLVHLEGGGGAEPDVRQARASVVSGVRGFRWGPVSARPGTYTAAILALRDAAGTLAPPSPDRFEIRVPDR